MKKMFMQPKTYLMSFERMIQLLRDHGVQVGPSRIMSLTTTPSKLLCRGRQVTLSNDLFEKLMGTWWEVQLSRRGRVPSECIYLADSLQDALRLRPGIDTAYWCGTDGGAADFVAGVADWLEDECFVD